MIAALDAFLVKVDIQTSIARTAEEEQTVERVSKADQARRGRLRKNRISKVESK